MHACTIKVQQTILEMVFRQASSTSQSEYKQFLQIHLFSSHFIEPKHFNGTKLHIRVVNNS